MSTAVFTHATCLEHDPGGGHPESPARLRAIHAALDHSGLPLTHSTAPAATHAQLSGVHAPALVDHILTLQGRHAEVDADTVASPRSVDAAVLAAGAAAAAVDMVMDGAASNAMVLVRPPGHHATHDRSMGFCFFNNVAVAAARARERGAGRVLVVDWDVHHGNGTQDIFYARPDVLVMGTHQYPFYPGTGRATEQGHGDGRGYTVNVPLPAGTTDGDLQAAFHDVLLPVAHAFRPDVVLISAGFDAHAEDPLGQMEISTDGFAALCGAVLDVARTHAQGRTVLLLEGGYNTHALADSVVACARVFTGAVAPPLRPNATHAAEQVTQARRVHRECWGQAL